MSILELQNVSKSFGQLKVTDDASFTVPQGQALGIIGPNGAGLPPFAAANVAKTPLVGGQWRLRDGGGYDLVIVDNSDHPDIPTGGSMEEIPS